MNTNPSLPQASRKTEAAPRFDVIIAGAGPAGASAAYALGEAGQRVLVLEKETLPRYKACGGGLSAHMLEKWFPFSFDSVIETRPRSISYALGRHQATTPLAERSLRLVMRDRFDAYLLAHVQAEVRPGQAVCTVQETAGGVCVETTGGAICEGRYLIGADGANSAVARAVGLRPGKLLAAALEAEAAAPPEVMARFAEGPLFIVGEVRQGYLWVFPKSDHLSVGIAALRPKAGELQATLKRVMARYGIALDGVPLRGHPIPIYSPRAPIATARTLLVGDAAGLADPFSGEGIRLAIKSGRLAAQAIVANHPAQYTRQVRQQIGQSHTVSLAAAWLFYRFQPLGAALLVPNPAVTRACLDMLADRATFPEVLVRAFGSLPFFLLRQSFQGLTRLFKSKPGRLAGQDFVSPSPPSAPD